MEIIQRACDTATVLALRGEFTYSTRKAFTAAVETAWTAGCEHLILNLEGVRFLDSAALGLLALTQSQCAQDRRRVSLVKPQPYVEEILRLANIHQLIPVYASEEAALALAAAAPTRV
jgi:anti-anti-sigma factor